MDANLGPWKSLRSNFVLWVCYEPYKHLNHYISATNLLFVWLFLFWSRYLGHDIITIGVVIDHMFWCRYLGRDIITIREAAWLTDNTYKYEDVVRMLGEISAVLLGNFRVSWLDTWTCVNCSSRACSNSQVIGCEDRVRNDLYCVGWGVKLYSIQSCSSRLSRS